GVRVTGSLAGSENEQGKPELDKRNSQQRHAGLEAVRDAVSREDVLDHFPVHVDIPDDDGDIAGGFAARQQIGDIATHGLNFVVAAGSLNDSQRVVCRKWSLSWRVKNEKALQ